MTNKQKYWLKKLPKDYILENAFVVYQTGLKLPGIHFYGRTEKEAISCALRTLNKKTK